MKTLTMILMSLSLILVMFFPSPSISSAVRCNPQDKKVLLAIKTALGNPYHLASWDPKTDCCGWYCLQCHSKTNRVIALNIFSGELSGQIPPAVGDLSYLETLFFHKLPNFVGTIPKTITKLTRLKSLEVSWTNISGPIPDFIGQIKSLNYLDLSFNKLTGSIPPSLSELPNLTELHLDRNRLTGSIPDSFGKFKGKVPPSLYLSHNQLTGYVPKSLGLMKFPNLDFSRNKLHGDISFLFGPGKELWKADFSRNLFQFDLSKVVFPKSLNVLDLNHNNIYGNLPQGLTSLNQLQFLNVSYNSLCGKIPVGGELQRFDRTVYFYNKCLCGAPLPAC
ncbi:polygalacturonase inhibitor-like [Impatiens glandulifera]|uniref:polygalacturonase inhibitor-like n=1 Tax=Impatiens glandulifera TaxID=253017 RepID=UPI001FB14135|nr:polygalacturonase inhibitor-like [Impatiens glandulifera]